jgi:hypothetical protein
MDEVVPKPVNIEVIKEILEEIIQWIDMPYEQSLLNNLWILR